MHRFVAVLLLLVPGAAARAAEFGTSGILDARLPFADGATSWTEEGLGKLYYDESEDGRPHLAFGGIDLSAEFNTRHALHGTVVYSDMPRGGLAISELFYLYRPVSLSGRRYQVKIGTFFPGFSLENVGTAWSSPYSLTTSALGSWIQEEIRATGVQVKTTWLGRFRGSPSDIALTAGLFLYNDPAGAILAWRGWTGHPRIVGFGEKLPAANTPFIQNRPQDQEFNPFLELDDGPGGYLQLDVRRERWEFLAAWYHTGAPTDILEDGQYSWRTRFVDLGLRWQGNEGWELITQWIYGDTKMESAFRRNVVVNDFDALYLLVARSWGPHRGLIRLESFFVRDQDDYPYDDNDERGHAITAQYSYHLGTHWEASVEAQQVVSRRDARSYFGETRRQRERQLQFGVRYLW